jgi:hypothetical protein
MNGGGWNPQIYQNTFPQNSSQYFYEAPNIGGYTNGDWYSTNYQGAQFSFPTNQEFAANSYYGGPTFNVGGNSFFENTYADNATYQNLTSNNINAQNITLQQLNDHPLPPPFFSPSQIGQYYADYGDYSTNNAFGSQAPGRPARKRFVTSVDVQGSVKVPTVTKAELQSDCTIRLTTQDVTISLDLNNDAPTEKIDYLAP